MIEGGSFNINNAKPTNNDLIIVFSPSTNIKTYTYNLYKDNNIIETKTINQNINHTFTLNQTEDHDFITNIFFLFQNRLYGLWRRLHHAAPY